MWQLSSPENSFVQFDLARTCGLDVSWNGLGDTILVCGTLLRLADGKACTIMVPFPQLRSLSQVFWLNYGHAVRRDGNIFDLTCQRAGAWHLEPGWRIEAVDASKGWAVLRDDSHYSVVDTGTHRTQRMADSDVRVVLDCWQTGRWSGSHVRRELRRESAYKAASRW